LFNNSLIKSLKNSLKKTLCLIIALQVFVLYVVNINFEYVHAQTSSNEIIDPLDDFDFMNWHSVEGQYGLGNLEFNTSNTNGFNDNSTIRQASEHWAEFNYHLDGAQTVSAIVYCKEEIDKNLIEFTACPNSDNSGVTSPSYTQTEPIQLENGWFKVTLTASLPAGTNFVGIKLKGCNDRPEVGLIRISTSDESSDHQNVPDENPTPDEEPTPDTGNNEDNTSQEIFDPLDNLNLINWHSVEGQYGLGDLEFNTSNTNGFNDTSTIHQASDHWSKFNYHLDGAKTVSATVYTKVEISEDIFEFDTSPYSDNSDSQCPEYVKSGWTKLENNWYKVTLTASLPEDSNYIGILLKGNQYNRPEVGAVRITTTSEILPEDVEMPLEINDPLNDFSMTNWHSVKGQYGLGDLEFNTSNSSGFNDSSTVRQSGNSWSMFNYNLNNAKWFEAVVYTKTDVGSKLIEITASPNSDGSEETYPSYARTKWKVLQDGWLKVTIKAILPDGTNYTGLRLKGNGNVKPEIGSIKITKTAQTLPEDSKPPIEVPPAYAGGGSYNPPIVQREMSIKFNSLKMANWHTKSITIDKSNPEGFKDTSPKIVRKSNTTQAVNFRVFNIRRAETVVYFKGDLPPLGLQYSLDNKNWEGIDYEIRIDETYASTKRDNPILALDINQLPLLQSRSIIAQATQKEDTSSAWKKATVIGVFPEGTKVINFTLLENEEGARNPQLAQINFKQEAGTININSNVKEKIDDKMANWYKANWHSDGLAFETKNAELFGNDTNRLVRTDNKWQCVNYKMEGLRYIEADFFFKGPKAPIAINASKDNKEWDNSISTYVVDVSDLENGWKKAKAVAVIPENYLYVSVQMLEASDSYKDTDIQIGNIKIMKTIGEASPVKNGVFEDTMNNLYLMNWYSTIENSKKYNLGELTFNTSNQNGFNDDSTAKQATNEWAIFSYKMDNVKRVEVIVYTLSDLGSLLSIESGTKPDGSDYKECPFVTTSWNELENGWNKANVVAILPDGTNYVNFKLMGSANNKAEIGNIRLSREAGEHPVNVPFSLKDNLDNWDKTNWHSTTENSAEYGMGGLIIGAPSDLTIEDNSTVRASSEKWATFNYAFDNLEILEAVVYTKTDITSSTLSIEAGKKSDGSDFEDVNYNRSNWTELDNGWYKLNISATFPERTKYLGILLKNKYIEVGQIKLSKTSYKISEDENMPPRIKIIDTFVDWSVSNWHSDGVFLEKANPDIFGSNVNVAAVKNSSWQGLNYMFYGVRRVEVVAYHKTDTPKVKINCSSDNSDWNDNISNILVSTEDIKSGYKKSNIVALLPEGANFVGVQFLENSNSDTSLKIAKVSLIKEAGATPSGTLLDDIGGGSNGGQIMRPGMEDHLKDWSKMNWHSDGLVLTTDNGEFFGDANRVMRTTDTWQGFNYRIEGVGRVEETVFFKGDESPTFISVSNDNKEWYNIPWHIGKITPIDDEWKTSTAYAIIPKEAKYVTLQLLESKIGEQTPHIGHVSFFKDTGELPPSMRDVLEDPFDDFTLMSWHSDGIKMIKDDGKSFENDTSRLGRTNNSWQGINYGIPNIRRVDVKVFYTDYPAININASFDNKFYMEMDLIKGKPKELSNGWKSVIVTAILSDGFKYVGIGLNENKGGPLAPQIGSITLSKTVGEEPVNYVENPPNTEGTQKVEGAAEVKEKSQKKVLAAYEAPKPVESSITFFDAIIRFWYIILIILLMLAAFLFRKKIADAIQNR